MAKQFYSTRLHCTANAFLQSERLIDDGQLDLAGGKPGAQSTCEVTKRETVKALKLRTCITDYKQHNNHIVTEE